jgi:hypothetical protein
MAKKKQKEFDVKKLPTNEELRLNISKEVYEQCEWCFQFDDGEPQIFAWTDENMSDEEPTVTFTLNNTKESYITFTKDKKVFKLFTRELSDAGKELRAKANEIDNQKNLENESENKEA